MNSKNNQKLTPKKQTNKKQESTNKKIQKTKKFKDQKQINQIKSQIKITIN